MQHGHGSHGEAKQPQVVVCFPSLFCSNGMDLVGI
jgi:hypothetical protein